MSVYAWANGSISIICPRLSLHLILHIYTVYLFLCFALMSEKNEFAYSLKSLCWSYITCACTYYILTDCPYIEWFILIVCFACMVYLDLSSCRLLLCLVSTWPVLFYFYYITTLDFELVSKLLLILTLLHSIYGSLIMKIYTV